MPKSEHAQDEDVGCGVGACKPRWASRLANPKLFVVSWCFVIMIYLMAGAYINGVLTTLEKRFDLQSRDLGLIASSADIGSMLAVLFVTYYGGKPGVNRPRIIAVGCLFLAFGASMSGLPHFIAPPYDATVRSIENQTAQDTCDANRTMTECGKEEKEAVSSTGGWLALLLFAQVIYGAGGTPIKPLGTTYIDDQVSKASAPIYLGMSYIVFGLGIPLGFVLSAFAIKLYVDIDKGIDPSELGLTPGNPLWVGAWWLGFFVAAAALLVVALPMFFFPAAMKRPEDRDDAEEEKDEKKSRMLPMMDNERREPLLDPAKGLWEQIKGMIKSLKDILTNATFMMLCLSGVCNTSVSGAYSFMPKYMEVQFGVPKSRANLLIAPVVLPCMIVGILGSSYIIKRFKMSPKQCVYMSMVCTTVASLGFIAMFFFSCPVPPMAGVTIPYGYSPYMSNVPSMTPADVSLITPCNSGCSCSLEKYSPVCGADGVTYFSGCHAGCTEKQSFVHPMGFKLSNYSNCACLAKLTPEALMKLAAKFGKGGKRPGGKPPSGNPGQPGKMPPGGGMTPGNGPPGWEGNNGTSTSSGALVPSGNGTQVIPAPPNGHNASGNGRVPDKGAGKGGSRFPPGMRMPNFAIGAPCPQICKQWKYFLGTFVATGFVSSFGFIPSVIAVLRSLTPETKSFGMGVQIVFYRLIGFIPSPIYFGALIDSTCSLWNTTCGRRGACLLYDLDRNRYYFLGLMIVLRMCSVLFELVAARLFKKQEEAEPEEKKVGATNRDIATSLGSLTGSIKQLDTVGRDGSIPRDTDDLRMNIWKRRDAELKTPLA